MRGIYLLSTVINNKIKRFHLCIVSSDLGIQMLK